MALATAAELLRVGRLFDLDVVWKASFDKANRSSGASFRGLGMEEGLAVLGRVKEEFDCPVLTDVHEANQCEAGAAVVDVLQIPAFLSRQTDLLTAAGRASSTVNLKKGQFMAPWQVAPAVAKLKAAGAREVWVTERGTTFGHGDVVVDYRAFPTLRAAGDAVLIDASHAAQRPGGHGDRSGGKRLDVPLLAFAGAGAGADGLFLEFHPDPCNACSDADTQWPLAELEGLVRTFVRIWEARRA